MSADLDCPRREDVAAYVAGEVDTEFMQHLASCDVCTEEAAAVRKVVSFLRTAPQPEASADLTPAILAAVKEIRPAPRYRWPLVAAISAAAAAVVLFFGLSHSTPPVQPILAAAPLEDPSLSRALDWLCRAQESDGSWSAARWGGDRRFEVALTSLPLLALLSEEHPTAPQREAIDRGVSALERMQAANGSFGTAFFGASYNQGLATLALLRAYQRTPSPELKRTIANACQVIVGTQTASGGWGYLGSPVPHPAVTMWNLEALELANSMSVAEVKENLSRGQNWVHAQSPATRALSQKDGVDFYTAYLLKYSDDAPSRERFAEIRKNLVGKQVRDGEESGSWSPTDRWGRIGGRLYATALASLSLAGR